MSDNDTDGNNGETQGTADDQDGSEEPSFRERVEEMQERGEDGEGEQPQNPFGGGGMGGGNPMAQMMGGMMGGGGGPPGMGGGGGPPGMGGGPGGPGGSGGRGEEVDSEELVQEVRQIRDEMRDQTRALKRIADAVENL